MGDRRLAAAMHIATIPLPFLAPAFAFLLFQRRDFVRAHSLQALYGALGLKVLTVVATLASVTITGIQLWNHYQNGWQDWSWPLFILRVAAGWLAVVILGFLTTVAAIMAAHRAVRGEWPSRRRKVVSSAIARRRRGI
jgi:uncharacterized membrane protein